MKIRLLAILLAVAACGFLAVRITVPSVTYAFQAEPEHEDAEKEEAAETRELIYKIINFVILAGALGFILRKPMAEFFSGRSASIRKALEEGTAALKESQAKLDAVEAKLNRLAEEISAFRANAEKEMQAERQRLLDDATHEAEKILDTARMRIDTATRGAKLELQSFTAQRALELAEQMIRQRLDEPSRQRLVSQFVDTLESAEKRN